MMRKHKSRGDTHAWARALSYVCAAHGEVNSTENARVGTHAAIFPFLPACSRAQLAVVTLKRHIVKEAVMRVFYVRQPFISGLL